MTRPTRALAALTALAVVFASAGLLTAQSPDEGAGKKPTTRPAETGRKGVLKLPHLKVDLPKRRVEMDANVVLRKGMLELLVCLAQTKEHESIMATRARPSDLHAALLMLGIRPGKAAEYLPPRAIQEGVFLPPRGAELRISMEWVGEDGETKNASAADWLATTDRDRQEKPAGPPKRWVFVGSDLLPDGRYWADESGDLICVANFASAVIDVPFASSDKNQFLEYSALTKAIPPVGTRVKVFLEPVDGARKADHARALLEIDRLGRMRMDSRPITQADLVDWAEAFVARHAKGRVVIRTAPQTLTAHLEAARRELEFGGVDDVEEQRLVPEDRLLPRTAGQAREAMAFYEEGFKNPDWTVPDPVKSARHQLRLIAAEIEEFARRRSLLTEYRQYLQDKLSAYEASTQPADSDEPAEND